MTDPGRSYAIGYSTCGFASGRGMAALIDKLGELGYQGAELELDRTRFHPQLRDAAVIAEVRRALERTGIRAALGSGGRYVLSETRHHPCTVSINPADRRRWLEFLKDSLRLSAEVGAECVMIHSGYAPEGVDGDTAFGWLISALEELIPVADRCGQRLALEWHPDMLVRTATDLRRVLAAVPTPTLGCTLDVGHAHCTEHQPLEEVIETLAHVTYHVQLEDMKDRVHKHLRLGAGEIDFGRVFEAFDRTGFRGIVALEFNAGDMEDDGDSLAAEAIGFLRERIPSYLGGRLS